MDNHLSVKQAAALLGVPIAQLLRWAAQREAGLIAGPPFIGSWMQPRYDAKELAAWRGVPLALE